MRILRSVSLLLLASCALASEAAVRYTFASPASAFSLTTGSPITTTTTFAASALDSSTGLGTLGSVTFNPDVLGLGFVASLQVHSNSFGAPASDIYFFNVGTFTTYGTYSPRGSVDAVLTVTNLAPNVTSAVPGPMAALPFALMAIKRRKRA